MILLYEKAKSTGQVDKEIEPVLDTFNDLGYMPINGCWGHSVFSPYVTFGYSDNTLSFMLEMQASATHFPFEIIIDFNILGRTITIEMPCPLSFRADYRERVDKWWMEMHAYLLSHAAYRKVEKRYKKEQIVEAEKWRKKCKKRKR